MKKIIFYLLIVLSQSNTFGQAKSFDFNSQVGKHFKIISDLDAFKKFKSYHGISIDDKSQKYNFGFEEISDAKTTLILFTKYISPNIGSEILAINDIGKIEKNTKIVMARCRLNLKNDGYILALVKPNPSKEYFTNIIKAWRVDKKTNQFISIPVKGIDCYNFEYDNF